MITATRSRRGREERGTEAEHAATASRSNIRNQSSKEDHCESIVTVKHERVLRILLVSMGVPSDLIGLWAGFAPRGFYDESRVRGIRGSLPTGRSTRSGTRRRRAEPRVAVVTIAAAVWLTRPLVRATAWAWLDSPSRTSCTTSYTAGARPVGSGEQPPSLGLVRCSRSPYSSSRPACGPRRGHAPRITIGPGDARLRPSSAPFIRQQPAAVTIRSLRVRPG